METRSKELQGAVNKRFIEKATANARKYSDRGTSGAKSRKAELGKILDKSFKDDQLITQYGKDAPNARSFMSEDRPKKMAKGGKIDGCCMKGKTKGTMR
jgi:hypothetical protein